MLPRDRAEKILTLGEAGWSVPAIAAQLGHSEQTVRDYLTGRRTPGVRAPRPSLLTDMFAGYCRQRFAEDPHLRPSALFTEITELGFKASRSTFYRELTQRRLAPSSRPQSLALQAAAQDLDEMPRPVAPTPARTPALPRQVTPITGETLISYLTRLATANHLTTSEILVVLPTWFTTKINNPDERAQHHMLAPATTDALHALARLTGTSPAGLARALPAFGTSDTHGPPATDAPPAAASSSPSLFTCPPTTRSAPATASGSATPASPTSTSPPARRSSPPSTWPTDSCAATRPSNCYSPTKPRPNRSLPGQRHQQPSRSTGGTGSSHCKPPTTATAPPPTTTPTSMQRSTPTPSPSPQQNSTLAPPGQLRWYDTDHSFAT